MRTLEHIHDEHRNGDQESLFHTFLSRLAQLSETIWLGITFMLFLLMGPFSVIAVFYGLWALGSEENRKRMVEPVSC